MNVAIIVAVDRDHGIGKDNDLMWHLPDDMKFFKETTKGHIVVMGRKNWDSIPSKFRPFSDRENIVLTRNRDFRAEGAIVYHSLQECLLAYEKEEDRTIFIIGGGEIYKQALELGKVDEMYITRIDATFDADTFFPEFDENEWSVEVIGDHDIDERHPHTFTFYRYTRPQCYCA